MTPTDRSKTRRLALMPSVHVVLQEFRAAPLDHGVLASLVREEIGAVKRGLAADRGATKASLLQQVCRRVAARIDALMAPGLKRVINATGVLLHTGLGRAPLAPEARRHLEAVLENYADVELDLETGGRGDRSRTVSSLLTLLTGAEHALVVNNNAAAVLLALNSLAFGKEVLVSRGELVEIGGSFRLPEIMAQSGVILKEVGTTNKTHLRDYERAVTGATALILKVHTSNFKVVGFTTTPAVSDLAGLARTRRLPLVFDAGSGLLRDVPGYALAGEPVIGDAIAAGADLVLFSGDKLVGACQAGLVVGRRKWVQAMALNPLMRALRSDKMQYAVLEATLREYLSTSDGPERLPVFRMLREEPLAVKARADRIVDAWAMNPAADAEVVRSEAEVGSGALPLEKIPSWAVAVRPRRGSVGALSARLRKYSPPIVGYVRGNRYILDMRTVRDDEVDIVIRALRETAGDS